MTIYMPDDLAAEVKAELSDTNLSAICQEALRTELARVRAQAQIAAQGFERVEVYDVQRDENVAFKGRQIGRSYSFDLEAWLTPKGAIAVYDARYERLYVYEDYAAFAASSPPSDLGADVASVFGQRYVRELDI